MFLKQKPISPIEQFGEDSLFARGSIVSKLIKEDKGEIMIRRKTKSDMPAKRYVHGKDEGRKKEGHGSASPERRPGRSGASSKDWMSDRPGSSSTGRKSSRPGASFQDRRPRKPAGSQHPFPITEGPGPEPSSGTEKREDRGPDVIYGVNPVIEAFKAGRGIDKVILARGRAGREIAEIINQARSLNLKVSFESREVLSRLTRTESHQGVLAFVSAGKYSTLDEILKRARRSEDPPFLLVLDGIQDPQNLGAIIRTAVCAGVHGIIIPKDRAVGLTGTVDKVSAGALSHMAIAKVTNVAQTIGELKRDGFWVIGAYRAASQSLYSYEIEGPLALVIGSEGEGIRPLVAKKCDMLVSIPIKDKVSSLNASAAAAIIMFEVVRQRGFK